MLTNKDIRVENGNIVINGDKYPLDGQSPAAIMAIVEDNSDSTPTENSDAPITSGGVYNSVAALSGNFSETLYTDFDVLPHGSVVQVKGSAAHAPGISSHYYIVFTYFIGGTTNFRLQFAIENAVGDLYTRDCQNGTWGNWNKFAKSM